jgi:hypothetical protein
MPGCLRHKEKEGGKSESLHQAEYLDKARVSLDTHLHRFGFSQEGLP